MGSAGEQVRVGWSEEQVRVGKTVEQVRVGGAGYLNAGTELDGSELRKLKM